MVTIVRKSPLPLNDSFFSKVTGKKHLKWLSKGWKDTNLADSTCLLASF